MKLLGIFDAINLFRDIGIFVSFSYTFYFDMKLDLKYYISGNQLPVLVKDLSKQKLPLVTLSCPSITGRWLDSTLMHA